MRCRPCNSQRMDAPGGLRFVLIGVAERRGISSRASAGVTTGIVVRVRDAVVTRTRSGGLALLVAREGAIAKPGILIALNAKRICSAYGLCRNDGRYSHCTDGKQR